MVMKVLQQRTERTEGKVESEDTQEIFIWFMLEKRQIF